MTNSVVHGLPRWSLAVPPLALVVLVLSWGRDLGAFLVILVCAGLGAAVIAAVHHAEVVAHRVGEPFGTLILALAVTVIEVALIVTLMASGGDKAASLARDTVFAAVMITCNGILGLSLVVGSLRHRTQQFRVHASGSALAVMTALVTLSLVLPTFTTSTPGATFSGAQLAFAGVVSLVMYGVFVFVQTIRHRDYFLPVEPAQQPAAESAAAHKAAAERSADAAVAHDEMVADDEVVKAGDELEEDEDHETHAAAPSTKVALSSLVLLFLCLLAVVGLAKTVSPKLESAVESAGAPLAVVGVIIALLVLLPETVAAVRAALRNRLQTSLNLALGSALASIGLTIPAIAVASIWLTGPLVLGLGGKEMVLFALTVVVSMLTLATGRATLLQGAVHLMIFSSFLFLAVSP
ncbi:sodium/calcium exchanger membrane region [Kribbella flavida DSM 17836]|uniref:Sodium/calcium exchanger membrane region n=1 Tax=Kribbella flavida (strain DSM 17836 / JCM 10339 / NBRC 14399) TaxID=479435 RepID=D2Q3N1_KRIFD|nr:ionic transporter y4hA [Kribbella flavida]ADB35903.1 sodium/calcium exchanger membrane region [Kribbella flavida DSM 17836]